MGAALGCPADVPAGRARAGPLGLALWLVDASKAEAGPGGVSEGGAAALLAAAGGALAAGGWAGEEAQPPRAEGLRGGAFRLQLPAGLSAEAVAALAAQRLGLGGGGGGRGGVRALMLRTERREGPGPGPSGLLAAARPHEPPASEAVLLGLA
jgi:hypothetical protein